MRDASESAEGSNRLSSDTVVVLAGGGSVERDVSSLVPSGSFVVAADSGLHLALAHDIGVDLVIGDLDSVSADSIRVAEGAGVRIERHPVAKDETDLELALDRAIERRPGRIVVIGGHGGRSDHFIANAFLLTSNRYRSARVEAHWGRARVHVVRDAVDLDGEVDELLTLLPVHGAAHGVTTTGLVYPLRGETLNSGTTRGVSNRFAEPRASVRLEAGVILAIAPGEHVESDQPGGNE
jgi:thiamine pyrophosphokinase